MIRPQDKNIYKPYLAAINSAIDNFVKASGKKEVEKHL